MRSIGKGENGKFYTIEELLYDLSRHTTIVLVTHNLQQAARVSTDTAFLLDGRLVEAGPTRTFFTSPRDVRTEAYVTGRAVAPA